MHHFPDESILKLMLHHLYVLLLGFIISFLGQLPLGNMNLTATQLSVQENLRNAWKYGLGIVLVEIIYLRLALTGMDWVVEHKQLFTIIGWLTIFVFMVLGVLAFVMARKQTSAKKGLILNNKMNRFLLGVVVSGINPAQIPFWFLWSNKPVLRKDCSLIRQ
jgi:threonine/homoserine/homoserine lactone efflux protein